MSDAPPPEGSGDEGSVLRGLGLLLLWHLLQIPGLLILAPLWIGLSQLFYVIPLSLRLKRQGQLLTHKGLWIGACLTFLLNATCWGVLFADNRGFH